MPYVFSDFAPAYTPTARILTGETLPYRYPGYEWFAVGTLTIGGVVSTFFVPFKSWSTGAVAGHAFFSSTVPAWSSWAIPGMPGVLVPGKWVPYGTKAHWPDGTGYLRTARLPATDPCDCTRVCRDNGHYCGGWCNSAGSCFCYNCDTAVFLAPAAVIPGRFPVGRYAWRSGRFVPA